MYSLPRVMFFNAFLLNLGLAYAIVFFIQLADGELRTNEYGNLQHRNVVLSAKRSAPPVRKLQCKAAAKTALRQLLASPEISQKRYKDEVEGESHTEICYRNDEDNEFNENPPTIDPNLLPPSVPQMEIKTNSSILVSWVALKQEKYPIDYFMVEFYQYNGTVFCSKCCTWVKNEINETRDAYHEELIDGLESDLDYKFRVAASYPTHNQSWGPWSEQIHLPRDFEGEDAFDHD